MLNKILTTLLFIVYITPSFAQLNKKEQKKLKTLKKQFEFVSLDNRYFSKPKNCNKIIVGNYSKGPSDGGGSFNKGITNLKIVTLDGDVIEQINDYGITLPFGNDNRSYKHIIRTISSDGKVGLMNNCGNIILPPTYNHINLFNKDGLAVAFAGNSIDVINSEGKSILTEKIPYKVNYKDFWTVPNPGEITQLQVINGRIFIADGNGKYAIFDVENKTNITDFNYTYLSTNTVTLNDKIYVKASIAPYKTLVDINSGIELLPNDKFYDIDGVTKFEGIDYIRVIANEEPYNRNLFNLSTQELLLPTNFKLWDIRGAIENNPNLIIISSGSGKGFGIFDLQKKQFLLEPNDNYTSISTSVGSDKLLKLNALVLGRSKSYHYEFFDLNTMNLLNLYISNRRVNLSTSYIYEFNDKSKLFRVSVQPSPSSSTHYYVLYDKNWKELYNGKASFDFNKEEGYLKISEKSETGEIIKSIKIDKNGTLLE